MPEHGALEREIQELWSRLETESRRPERRDFPHQEILREVVREKYAPPPTTPLQGEETAPAPQASGESPFLPNYLKEAPAEVKLRVEQLIELAWHEGIGKGVEKAYREGLFFLNAFHDALADKLYREFKNRGLLK